MRQAKRGRVVAGVVAWVLLGGFVATSSAGAADARIGLSWDGQTWSTSLTGTLFGRSPIGLWVPGDADTEHFYVRNQAGEGARLAVDYQLPSSPALAPTDIALSVSLGGAAPVALVPGSGVLPLAGTSLENGGIADVAVTALFSPASSNRSRAQQVPVLFRVTLSEIAGPAAQEGAPGGGDGGGDGDQPDRDASSGGLLPGTGAPEVRWAVGLGLFCLGGGVAIVVLSRRKGEREC